MITSHRLKLIILSTTKIILLILAKLRIHTTIIYIMLIEIGQKVKENPAATEPRVVIVFLQGGDDLVVE